MRKLLLTCAVLVAAIAPTAASAADPAPSDFKNAAHYCKAFKKASGANFASMFGSKKNAYGKCVSQKAKTKKDAADQADAKAIAKRKSAAKTCATERKADADAFKAKYGTNANKSNAFGKCVSATAKKKSES